MAAKPPLVAIDVSYLAYRAFYSTGHLSYDEVKTGVLFGVFRDVKRLAELWLTQRFVFCFDSRTSKRAELLPGYKKSRKEKRDLMDEDEKQAFLELCQQIDGLRTKYLPKIGYRNLLHLEGYEADDLIAAVAETVAPDDELIIVGRDRDLLQVLRNNVSLWDPSKQKIINAQSFVQTYGLSPSQWADVKAIAGCSTDDVPGVKGVGETTAAKFLTGTLKPSSKKYQDIISQTNLWKQNLPLVRLPFEGCVIPPLVENEYTTEGWQYTMNRLGMSSLRELMVV